MQMLYNSDSYTVVQFNLPADPTQAPAGACADPLTASGRGGFEIVDKSARTGTYLQGAMADSFQRGVQELVAQGPDADALDAFIAGFTQLARQPLALH
jgi:hypothetical protein